jgi:membrane protease YdiL (CAAX protease family)
MALKFSCYLCQRIIDTGSLSSGDMFRCPGCGGVIRVPSNAQTTDETPNLIIDTPGPPESEQPAFFEDRIELNEPISPSVPTIWGIGDIFYFIGASILLTISLSCIITLLAAAVTALIAPNMPALLPDWPDPYGSYYWEIILLLTNVPIIGVIYHIVSKKHHNDFFEALHLKKISKRQILRYSLIAAGIVAFIMALAIVALSTPLRNYIPKNPPSSHNWFQGYTGAIITTISALVAAVVEEIIFRGFIFSGLKQRLGQNWSAIMVSVIFTIIHGTAILHNPFYLISLMLGSTILIMVRIKTGSLTNAILVHFFYNMIILAIQWIVFLGQGAGTKIKMP